MCGRFVLKNAEQIPLRFDATADDAGRVGLYHGHKLDLYASP